MAQILWFETYSSADAPVLGGKNASLGALMAAGLPVPPGFAVSADCYRKALADGGLTAQLDALIAAADPHDPASVAAAGAQARALIGALAASGDLADAIRAAYARLCERCGDGHLPVAVRSSATCEDQPDASFAGEHDTYLWVRGGDAVVPARTPLLGEPVHRSRHRLPDRAGLRPGQRGDECRRAADAAAAGRRGRVHPQPAERRPVAGRHRRVLGLRRGRGQRRGHPGQFPGRQGHGRGDRRTISDKTLEYRLIDSDTVTAVPVDADRQSVPCLTDDEILAVARLARRAEKHYRCPQDVEWALEDSGDVLLLQSRPETVWSRRARPAASCTADPITSMVQTLLNPSHGMPEGHGHG